MSVIKSQLNTRSDEFRANAERIKALVEDLKQKVATVTVGGEQAARDKHSARGKLLPRERVRTLLDPGSPFLEVGQLAAWGMYSGAVHSAAIICNIANLSAAGIPQIACVMGSCTAGGAYVPAMSDESIIVKGQGTIFLGGPPLVEAATGEVVTAEELGGAEVHTRISGVADHYALNDAHALALVRRIVSNLNYCKQVGLDVREPREPLYAAEEMYGVIPADPRKPYDV